MATAQGASGPAGSDVVAGRYRVLSQLGRGGAGAVHGVLDERTGTRRALKRLHAPLEQRALYTAQFEREGVCRPVTTCARLRPTRTAIVDRSGRDL